MYVYAVCAVGNFLDYLSTNENSNEQCVHLKLFGNTVHIEKQTCQNGYFHRVLFFEKSECKDIELPGNKISEIIYDLKTPVKEIGAQWVIFGPDISPK